MVNAYNHNEDRMYLAGSSDNKSRSIAPKVGLFFYVEGRFAFSGCELSEAETYGDFLIFPESLLAQCLFFAHTTIPDVPLSNLPIALKAPEPSR